MKHAIKILESELSARKSCVRYSRSGSEQAQHCMDEIKDIESALKCLREHENN
jgi:hypothetical protein